MRQKKLYDLVEEGHLVSFKELQSHYPKVPRRTLQNDLRFLKNKQYVSTKGRGKAAAWFAENLDLADY